MIQGAGVLGHRPVLRNVLAAMETKHYHTVFQMLTLGALVRVGGRRGELGVWALDAVERANFARRLQGSFFQR